MTFNTIDFIVLVVLFVAVWRGWRQGLILQVCSLVSLFAGVWLAAKYGAEVGALLSLGENVRLPGGFLVVLLVALVAVSLLGRLLKKVFEFAGFGLPDVLLGIGVSVVKYLLVLSLVFSAIERMDLGAELFTKKTMDASRCFRPVAAFSEWVFPFVKEAVGQLPEGVEKLKKTVQI